MTDAEHAALSADLARALGHPFVALSQTSPVALVPWPSWSACTRIFDYRDPNVYGPLTAWLTLQAYEQGKAFQVMFVKPPLECDFEEAIARAVIAVVNEG